jgi:hypothetical protein
MNLEFFFMGYVDFENAKNYGNLIYNKKIFLLMSEHAK